MTPEGRHLLTALHEPGERDEALLDRLTTQQWDNVAALAIRQRLGSLLFSRAPRSMPTSSRATLKRRAEWSTKRGLFFAASLRELADRASSLGIPLVALKGMHLAHAYYESPAQREMVDIDVLVPRDAAVALQQEALDLGYRPYAPTSIEVALEVSHHLPALVRDGVTLEVHVGLHPPPTGSSIDAEALLTRSSPLSAIEGVFGLSAEDLILHLCLHATLNHTLGSGLRPLVDLQVVLAKSEHDLDWDYVAAVAEQWRCSRGVDLMLTLAHRHLNSPLPGAWSRHQPRPIPDGVAEAAVQFITDDALNLAGGREAQLMVGIPGWRRQWQHLLSRVALDPHQLAALYPHSERNAASRAVARLQRLADVVRRNAGWYLRVKTRRAPVLREAIERRNQLDAWLSQG